MTDTYYRDRIAAAERDAENARAARMAALWEALYAVSTQDVEVLSDDERAAFDEALAAVSELRRVW